ncbi:MAG: hypothetical protein QOE03_825 [Micromonosporaceae bacterium]|jgi:hypothetical protein|nr:hypothetical protein [Micromonosporaceae bacterium]
MSSDKVNGIEPTTIEWGDTVRRATGLAGRLGEFTAGRPVIRGAGIGCALAGFGALIAAELLPWMSMITPSLGTDFPTGAGGRVEMDVTQLLVGTDILNLGWLVILGVVATALVVGPAVRRVVVAAGLGLVAGQVALLTGVTRGIKHSANSGLFRGVFVSSQLTVKIEVGVYCAYLAVGLFGLALVLAGGVPRRLRTADRVSDDADPSLRGPADLTVTPGQAGDAATDRTIWSRRSPDIDMSGGRPDR